jgi:hypothetical protein
LRIVDLEQFGVALRVVELEPHVEMLTECESSLFEETKHDFIKNKKLDQVRQG